MIQARYIEEHESLGWAWAWGSGSGIGLGFEDEMLTELSIYKIISFIKKNSIDKPDW